MQATINYTAPAELFFSTVGLGNRKMSYRRFPNAAEAIIYAIETLGLSRLRSATLQVDEARFAQDDILRLYDDPGFPLKRRPLVA